MHFEFIFSLKILFYSIKLDSIQPSDVIVFHTPIRIYIGGLILGVNTLYRLFCFFKLFPMGRKSKGLFIRLASHNATLIG